jgi:molecular chaperone DnaK
LPSDKKEPIKTAVEKLKEAHKKQDLDAVEKATAELNTAWQTASEELYKASQQTSGAQAGPTEQQASGGKETKNDQEVTDVDFEEVK